MSRQRVVQLTIDVHQSLLHLIHPHTVCPDIVLLAGAMFFFAQIDAAILASWSW
jgi:hypothetical protein